MSILSLDSILRKVLSIGNKEQNQHYPPNVFTQHFNLATNTILNELCQNYPKSQDHIDLLRPFIVTETVIAKNGVITLPNNYRRLLSAGVYVKSKDGQLCSCDENGDDIECSTEFDGDPLAKTKESEEKKLQEKKCFTKDVSILSQGEWDKRTTHSYKQPKLDEPIASQMGRILRICPMDVGAVEVRYVRHPKEYCYGYVVLPDGTYQYDKSKSVESEWEINATEYFVNAIATLYSVYTRDAELEKGLMTIKQLLY